MSRGVDISSYQGTVDFDALRPAVDFVIAKATEGSGFIDREFARNWTETKRVGLRRGAYHFAVPDLGSSAQDEARHFLSVLGPLDPSDMIMLDYERDWSGDVVRWCGTWLDLVKSVTGITPYIYLNLYLSHVYDWGAIERPGGYPLWLADYDGLPDKVIQTPWPRVAIKQWTSSGTLPGIAGLVDLNSMEEDMDETTIREWAKEEARVVLKKEYGPRLEEELQQRFAEASAKVEAALAANPNTDSHVSGVVIQTMRAVFDGIAGDQPKL